MDCYQKNHRWRANEAHQASLKLDKLLLMTDSLLLFEVMIDDFLRKLKHSRKYTPDFWPGTPHLHNYYFPFRVVFSFLIMTDHSPRTINRRPRGHNVCSGDSWKERLSLLISWCPEAQLPLFLLVKLWLLTCGCFGHPSLLFLRSSYSSSRSLSSSLGSLRPPPGRRGTFFCISRGCMFAVLRIERLKLCSY